MTMVTLQHNITFLSLLLTVPGLLPASRSHQQQRRASSLVVITVLHLSICTEPMVYIVSMTE